MPQPRRTGPADRLRRLVAGQQGQRAAAVGVVERPLQCREVAAEHVTEPVDHPDPVTDQVGAMSHQQPQFGHQRGGDLHLLKIAAVPQRFGYDVGVAGVGLGFTAVCDRHLVHRPAGHVPHSLTVRRQQREQQPGHGPGDVDSPDDLVGAGEHAADRVEDRCLVVHRLRRPDRGAGLVDEADPVMTFADIDARPAERDLFLHQVPPSSMRAMSWPEGTPRRQIRKQRPGRASQSAVKASQEEPGGQSIGAIRGDQGSATPSPPGPPKNLRIEA